MWDVHTAIKTRQATHYSENWNAIVFFSAFTAIFLLKASWKRSSRIVLWYIDQFFPMSCFMTYVWEPLSLVWLTWTDEFIILVSNHDKKEIKSILPRMNNAMSLTSFLPIREAIDTTSSCVILPKISMKTGLFIITKPDTGSYMSHSRNLRNAWFASVLVLTCRLFDSSRNLANTSSSNLNVIVDVFLDRLNLLQWCVASFLIFVIYQRCFIEPTYCWPKTVTQ